MTATYADRRAQLKSDMLFALALIASDDLGAWEATWSAADRVELGESTIGLLTDEIAAELMRRSNRLNSGLNR